MRILGLIKVQRKIDDHEEGSSSLHPAGESNTRVQGFNQAALAAVGPCLERLLIYMFLVRLAPLQMLSAVPRRKGGEGFVVVAGSLFWILPETPSLAGLVGDVARRCISNLCCQFQGGGGGSCKVSARQDSLEGEPREC